MTIPFGRRRIVVSVAFDRTDAPLRPTAPLLGGTDAELARLAQGGPGTIDIDGARWAALTLLYGGCRRS